MDGVLPRLIYMRLPLESFCHVHEANNHHITCYMIIPSIHQLQVRSDQEEYLEVIKPSRYPMYMCTLLKSNCHTITKHLAYTMLHSYGRLSSHNYVKCRRQDAIRPSSVGNKYPFIEARLQKTRQFFYRIE